MSEALEQDFYGANRHTPYPFNDEYTDVTSAFIDASVAIPGSLAGSDSLITYARLETTSGRSIELEVDGQVLIDRSLPVAVQAFGQYEIWTVVTSQASLTLVVDPQVATFTYDGPGLRLSDNVVSTVHSNEVMSLLANAQEVAGPGEVLTLRMGSHMEARVSGNRVVLSARYRPEGPCVPTARSAPGIKQINGQLPDRFQNLDVLCAGTFIVDNQTNGLRMTNAGKPCCDCPDYVDLFESVRTTHSRLDQIRRWSISNRSLYAKFVNYTKFLLTGCIVGGTPTDGTDNIADCS